jgi:hypothetical protein
MSEWEFHDVNLFIRQPLAPVAEQYDVDICGGHSPIYGFAGDGYPLYGPYESADTLAVSGWALRDYGADASLGGCNTQGQRSCTLVDSYDLSKGVTLVENGPDVGAQVTTLSGNILAATVGYYFEDHYYANAPVSGAQLDQHNGHDTNDGKGYHYHITLAEQQDGKLVPAFPYMIGPNFKGNLADNSLAQCGAAGGPPPGGAPPPGSGFHPGSGTPPPPGR